MLTCGNFQRLSEAWKFNRHKKRRLQNAAFHKYIPAKAGRNFDQIMDAITNATTDISFKRMFRDGPEVSLKGSPTVSPTTAAL